MSGDCTVNLYELVPDVARRLRGCVRLIRIHPHTVLSSPGWRSVDLPMHIDPSLAFNTSKLAKSLDFLISSASFQFREKMTSDGKLQTISYRGAL